MGFIKIILVCKFKIISIIIGRVFINSINIKIIFYINLIILHTSNKSYYRLIKVKLSKYN